MVSWVLFPPSLLTRITSNISIEHDVIPRNFERHRREAVTMEHLSQSPHVIDLYAFCGNTILTEFAPTDLSSALKLDGHRQHPRRRRPPPIAGVERILKSSTKTDDNNRDHGASSTTIDDKSTMGWSQSQRLNLALQAAKSIQVLHNNDIIHADLTAKQFLLLDQSLDSEDIVSIDPVIDGHRDEEKQLLVKVNDFNRCRFVPHISNANATNSTAASADNKCTIQIPSAPGLYRSPEEYAGQPLTSQIDIFSLGHVLLEIWTGKSPWQDTGGKQIRQAVQEGQMPSEVRKLLLGRNHQNHSIDLAMGRLISECYRIDPQQRITANKLVEALIRIIESR